MLATIGDPKIKGYAPPHPTTTRARPTSAGTPAERHLNRWLRPALNFGVWTVLAVVAASQRYLALLTEPSNRVVWWQVFAWQAPLMYLWALYTPLILRLGRRFPLERGRRLRSLAVHVLANVVTVSISATLSIGLGRALFPTAGAAAQGIPLSAQFLMTANALVYVSLLLYGAVLGVGYALDYYHRFRERELLAAQLSARLAEAQLQALRMELNPHFLFNALNAVAMLVRTGASDQAVRMIAGLSDLLRLTLQGSDAHEVRLGDELDLLGRYLEIEEIRFGDRLVVRMDIDPELLDAQVPNLILQPLVENALRYGIAPRAAAGLLEIRARRHGDTLELSVRDDGPGLPAGWSMAAAGVGLGNTRARLEQLYGPHQSLEVTAAAGGGTLARLTLPYHSGSRVRGEGSMSVVPSMVEDLTVVPPVVTP